MASHESIRELLDDRKAQRFSGARLDLLEVGKNPDAHEICWPARKWLGPSWHGEAQAELDWISNALGGDDEVRIRRDFVFEQRGNPLRLFLAAMAWGFGTTGYGWSRTQKILDENGVEQVCAATERLGALGGDPEEAWRMWSPGGDAKLNHLGTAFASKVAYFAAYDRQTGRGPLIADINTSWGVWAVAGIARSLDSAAAYSKYVRFCEEIAADRGTRSDAVELALFSFGKEVDEARRGA